MSDSIKRLRVELEAGSASFQKGFREAAAATQGLGKSMDSMHAAALRMDKGFTQAGQRAAMAMSAMHAEALKTNQALGGVGSKLNAVFQSLGTGGGISGALSAIGPAGLAAAAAFGVVSFGATKAFGAIKDLAAQAEHWSNIAKSTGLGVVEVQQLSTLLEDAGIPAEALTTTFKKMQVEIANGGKGLAQFGIKISDLKNLSPEEQFRTLAARIAAIEDPATRTAAAVAAFGRSGQELIPVLDDVASGADKMFDAMSGEQIEALKRTDDALDKYGRKLKFIGNQALVTALQIGEFLVVAGTEPSGLPELLLGTTLPKVKPSSIFEPSTLKLPTGPTSAELEKEKQLASALDKVAAAAKKSAEAFKALVASLSGAEAQKRADDLAKAFNHLGVEGVADLEKLRREIRALQEQGAKIGDKGLLALLAGGKIEVPKIDLSGLDLGEDLGPGIDAINTSLTETQRRFTDIAAAGIRAKLPIEEIEDALRAAGASADQARDAINNIQPPKMDGWDKWTNILGGIADLFGGLTDSADSAFGRIATAADRAARALQNVKEAGGLKTTGGKVEAFAGAANVGAALLGKDSKIGGALSGAAKGAQIGLAFGPWGAAIGAVGGAIVGFISKRKQLKKELEGMRADFIASVGGMDALKMKAKEAGVSIEAIFAAKNKNQLLSAIDEVKGKLDTWDEAHAKLQDAIDRYGFSIGELGPAMQRQALDEQAGQLLQDFKLLTASGIDVNTVIAKMGPSILDFVKQSKAAGQSIPLAMKPIIDKMIEQGLLLDENGKAYASAEEAGLTFTETLSEGLSRVIAGIDRLVAALTGIPPVTIPVNVHYRRTGEPPENLPPGTEPPLPGPDRERIPDFQHGGIGEFGSGTLAMLHGFEAIVPLERGSGGSDAGVVNELRAMRADQAELPRIMARAVRDALALS